MRSVPILDIALVALGVALYPLDAHAWGPVAHLDFALQILAGAAVVGSAVRRLIEAHSADFLYGSIAADAIVGKNWTRQRDHCHNWTVARKLLATAEKQGEPRLAFAIGYLGHLGADVIAHNHIVPRLLIAHYRAKGRGHIYWEMRSDEKLLAANPELGQVLKDLSGRRFKGHHKFLAKNLVTPLWSHSLSKQIYKRTLSFQRRAPWRRAFKRIERRSKLPFTSEEINRWRALAIEATRLAVDNPLNGDIGRYDPRGRAVLAMALSRRKALRRQLRKQGRGKRLDELVESALEAIPEPDPKLFGVTYAE
jgi:hypothetical protein